MHNEVMRRAVLPCIRPPCARSRRRRSSSPLLGDDTAAFCSSLVEGLGELGKSLTDVGGTVSMKWCAEAMRLMMKMQRELLALFKKSRLPPVISYGAEEDWFEQYMQETAALLDFCNTFKSAMSRFHRYFLVVQVAVQMSTADHHAVADVGKLEMRRSETTVSDKFSDVKVVVQETARLGSKVISGAGRDAKGMVVVMLIAKITMIVVSLLILSALVSPVSVDVGGYALGCKVPAELKPWCESLLVINGHFHGRFPSTQDCAAAAVGSCVAEHRKVAEVVRDLNAKLEGGEEKEEVLRCVEKLRTSSVELKEGVEMFDCVLDEMFDEVIKGRNEMLGIFRDKALTLG